MNRSRPTARARAPRMIAALALLALAACATSGAAIPLVRAHAGKDLDCAETDIRIEEELGGRYKAIGCGRKAYYRTACEALACTVQDDDGPAIPWRDRPEPESGGHR